MDDAWLTASDLTGHASHEGTLVVDHLSWSVHVRDHSRSRLDPGLFVVNTQMIYSSPRIDLSRCGRRCVGLRRRMDNRDDPSALHGPSRCKNPQQGAQVDLSVFPRRMNRPRPLQEPDSMDHCIRSMPTGKLDQLSEVGKITARKIVKCIDLMALGQ